jgi:hypothetical protein
VPVVFTYRLTGTGWAECDVCIDDAHITATASYLSDALGDLIRAVSNILDCAQESSFSFVEEPGEYRWHLTRKGDDRISVAIEWFDDWPETYSSPGKVLFARDCRLRTFAGAVYDACKQLLEQIGTEGYREKWINNDFPLDQFERLKKLLRAEPV